MKTKLARKAVKTTAKHTAHGAASKFARRPFRTVTLLALGASVGAVVGWLIGRSGGGEPFEPVAPSGPTSVVTGNSAERTSQTGAAS